MKNTILILSLILNVILGYLLFSHKSTAPNTSKIDSLEVVLSKYKAKRDSIQVRIDTIETVRERIKIKYEKDRDVIVHNNVGEDYIFFSNYIERYDSLYNSKAAENN